MIAYHVILDRMRKRLAAEKDGGNNLVSIFKSSTEKATIGADGLNVYDGDASNAVATFGATTYVGLQASEHIKIDGTSMLFYNGGNVEAELRGGTLTLGSAHGVTADNVVFGADVNSNIIPTVMT